MAAKKVQESPYNKQALIVIVVIIGLFLIGGLIYQASSGSSNKTVDVDSTSTTDVAPSEAPVAKEYKAEPTIPDIQPISLSGVGKQDTDPVTLPSGLVNVKLTHEGSGNFTIWLVNSQGTKIELLVNEIGSYDKSSGLSITNSGDYTFEINATGNWTINIMKYEMKS